jgi:hypothetical protein
MHMEMLKKQNPKKKSIALMKEHNTNFTKWLKNHFEENPCLKDDGEALDVYYLAQGPMVNVVTHQAYDINGYTFYTEAQDQKSVYQNSGVTMKARTGKKKDTYYGRIEEIWELDYTISVIPMFRVRWAEKIIIDEDNFITMVILPPTPIEEINVKAISAKKEPWVLAKQVTQCFYITDPKAPTRVVMRRGKRSIVGVDGVVDEEDYDQFDDPDTDEDDEDTQDSGPTRRDLTTLSVKRPFKRRSHSECLTYTRKKIKTTTEKIVGDDETET